MDAFRSANVTVEKHRNTGRFTDGNSAPFAPHVAASHAQGALTQS